MKINAKTFEPVDDQGIVWLDYDRTVYEAAGITGVKSRIVGAYYRGDLALKMVDGMKKGTALYIKPEPTNAYDKNAHAVYAYSVHRGEFIHIGYVERAVAYSLAIARSDNLVPSTASLSAKANGFGGLAIEGPIDPKQLDYYQTRYMKQTYGEKHGTF